MKEFFSSWFSKEHWKSNVKGFALILCSILYVLCDDHTDKILTGLMAILAIDSFSRKKGDI